MHPFLQQIKLSLLSDVDAQFPCRPLTEEARTRIGLELRQVIMHVCVCVCACACVCVCVCAYSLDDHAKAPIIHWLACDQAQLAQCLMDRLPLRAELLRRLHMSRH